MPDRADEFSLNEDLMLHEEVKALADGSVQGVFQRGHAEIARAAADRGENLAEVAAGLIVHERAEVGAGRSVGMRAFRPEKRHPARPLQVARGRKDLAPDRPDMPGRQRAVRQRGEALKHGALALRPEDGASFGGLESAYGQAQFRPFVEQGEEVRVNLVDAAPERVKFAGIVRHFSSPECFPESSCRSAGRPRQDGREYDRRDGDPPR